jgi:hypothetical protein
MPLKRNHVLVLIAIAGIIALTLIGAGVLAGAPKAGYVRISVSDKSTAFLQLDSAGLRAAMSIGGLRTAEPAKAPALTVGLASAPEVTLPIPTDQLPAGVTAVKVRLLPGPGRSFTGKLALCRTDGQKAVWEYEENIGGMTGARPEEALTFSLPDLNGLKLRVTAVPSRGRVAIGLGLSAGLFALNEIRKDGKAVPVSVSVVDSAAMSLAQKRGTLTDFGFS